MRGQQPNQADHHTLLLLPLLQTCGCSGVRRELYLCDDGKDPTKRVWLETSYGEGTQNAAKGAVHYVCGR